MQSQRDVIEACLQFPGAYEDYPFDDPNWAVMRHKGNRKGFAFVLKRQEKVWINVKHKPSWGDFWRSCFPAVVPAYHMNKEHWSSIILDGSMSEEEILRLITDSFELTAPKRKAKGSRDWED